MRFFVLTVAIFLGACGQLEEDSPTTDANLAKENRVATEIHDPETANMLDKNVVMPPKSGSLRDYERYYAKTEQGWIGLFVKTTPGAGKSHIMTKPVPPTVRDGGCLIIQASFEPDMKFVGAGCNGIE